MRQGIPLADSALEMLVELSAEEIAVLCYASDMIENGSSISELFKAQVRHVLDSVQRGN